MIEKPPGAITKPVKPGQKYYLVWGPDSADSDTNPLTCHIAGELMGVEPVIEWLAGTNGDYAFTNYFHAYAYALKHPFYTKRK
jgi:hypothetical protein